MRQRRANLTFGSDIEQALATATGLSDGSDLSSSSTVIYHCVFPEEDFGDTADVLVKLVWQAQKVRPGVRCLIFLDIYGHRNPAGGYDHDMFELQQHFIPGCLLRYVAEVHMPHGTIASGRAQRNDVPERLEIMPSNQRAVLEALKGVSPAEIYVADVGKWVRTD